MKEQLPGGFGVTFAKLLFDTGNREDSEYNTAIKNWEQLHV